MKTLILNGSPRRDGVTALILNKIEEVLSESGDVEHIRIYAEEIKPCVGCLKCRPDKLCVLPEDGAQKIAKLIEESDKIVLGSPTFWGNITGPMKTLFDRLVTTFEYLDGHSLPEKNLSDKTAAIVTVSNAPAIYNLLPSQSSGAVRAMRTIVKAGGMKIAGVLNFPDSSNLDKRRDKLLKKAERLAMSLIISF